ncbi:MAG: VOC family protein [Gammaproteobacteria bacterium]|nr:VOC family protein [Gammaproteobacteria bacterium]MBU1441021.1 VOC family protein [Gammaproteobacteria bacterium]MBU2285745.1 VOC family protein [Gammaproteobacteria bacterium]MBU2409774.1 VOC family protein [Gammaproteobacteria bacterium]
MTASIDHLVIAAASLEEGESWCRRTLGVTPGPGGSHPLMGTHNRLLSIGGPACPRAYLEIIAIDPDAKPARGESRRWFDLDDTALRTSLAERGPQLVHFVVEVADVRAAVKALAAQGIDRGAVIEATRDTPSGLLRWLITVRDDGQRLYGGALPTLIEWGSVHPSSGMTDSGVRLRRLEVTHPEAAELDAAYAAIGLTTVPIAPGQARLRAVLDTPRGPVTLDSADT